MNNLKNLPNQEGFEFMGVDFDGNEINCKVVIDNIGCHSVIDANGDPSFMKLEGWKYNVKK